MNPHEQLSSFIEKKQKFQPRPGSLDFGTNYEFLMAAYYGLALSLNVKVEDFKLSTNNKDMDNFDDVVLQIKFEDGEEHLYALQLKHRGGKEDNITLMSFTGDKGDHSLKKYCEGFKKVEKVCRGNLSYNIPFENFHFILYTNAFLSKFVTYDQNHKKVDADEVQLPKRPDMFIYKHDKCVAKDLINLCREESYFIYKFKTSKEGLLDGDFLNQFYLYTKQKNAKEMECFISKLIWSIFSNCDANVVTNYFNFFKNWWRGDFGTFKLTKQAVLLKLAEYVLTPHIPEVNFATFSPSDVKFSLLNECLSCFDLILIENSEGDEAEKVWKAILPNIFNEIDPNWSWNQPVQNLDKRLLPDGKKIPTSAQGENFIDQSLKKIYTILWHMDMVPMFVKVNNSYRKGIFTAMKLVQSQKKFIVQDENHIKEEFPEDMNIFRNLTDLVARGNVYGKICDELSVSLQGRQCVKLKELIDIDNRFLETISIKEILHMLDGNFTVGDNCKNNLPKHYVKRLTPKILLSIEAVDELTNDLFVIHCQEFNTLYPDFKLNTINFDKYILLNQDSVSLSKLQKSNKFVILANGETQQFREICLLNQNKNCHHVRVVDNKRIEWIETQGSVETLRLYQLNLNDFKDDDFVEDFDILNHFSSTINIICAEPGMGKSVLLKYLKYKCPTSHWVITVNLSDHISFFKELHQIEEVLEYFLNIEPETNFVRDVVKIFISQRKILFLWDAFDELPGNCLNSVVSTVKRLGENGYWQWIAARNNSKEFLESIFGLLSLTITQFSKQNQYDFIYNNLKERFEDENEVQLMVEKLNQNMSSSLNCGYFDYSGTPLQMYMVMEIFLKNPQKYLDEFKIVILTDIYQEFIEGKFESLFERANAVKKNPLMEKIRRKFKDTQLSQYEVAALKASFDEETFSILNLNCDKLLQELKENRDNLGIIFGMNNEKKPVFSHKTYEEFLTASWLVKNRDNHPHLVKMLFQENYKNIRLMFDMLLAKDSPVHIAVLYGNLDILEKRLDGIASIKDKGGRNPLHIACSWGSKHPLIDIIENNAEKNVISADGTIVHPNQNLEIVKLLLTHDCNPLEKDDLVNWSAVEYSDRTLSLSLIEVILAHNYSIDFEEMANFNDVHTLLYYSIKFYYPNLFFKLHRYPLIELRLEGGEYCSLLQFAVKMNRLDFVAKLLSFQHYQEVINVPYKDLGSCIFTAAGNGNLEMFNLLREKGANLDRLQISPLITSVAMGHKKLCQKLIEEGSSVNESNVDGNSVLQVAAMEKQIDIMKLFIENGADVNYVNNDLTALDYCVHNEMLEGVRLLVQNQGETLYFSIILLLENLIRLHC
ncbi:uncharacterized protein BDFB_007817 [Asbolus verrucosus]|uniref:Uncharacterized protein n=1 Tax=Asbolus verrucosus TaxID=1661398 RepID=A0A482VW07_ASBVE|nr:uncharacterized protein BDFB_007817 [Asbolus verrucosus]